MMTMTAESYRPSAIYSSMTSIQSEEDFVKLHRDPSGDIMNFSCLSYATLMEYCKHFKLHHFQYDYHYGLAAKSASNYNVRDSQLLNDDDDDDDDEDTKDTDTNKQAASARIASHSQLKPEMNRDEHEQNTDVDVDVDTDVEVTTPAKQNGKSKRRKKRSKTQNKRETSAIEDQKQQKQQQQQQPQVEHYYLESEVLDKHYCKRRREHIASTLDAHSKLTKTELVGMVQAHFLAQPLLKDLSELDVIQQFLRYIKDRRTKLKKELCLS